MPFYHIIVDWAESLSEEQQFNRMYGQVEQALVDTEHLIVGTTCLSTTRGRLTFQTEIAIDFTNFEGLVIDGALRVKVVNC
jgi:hypothetical protein